MSGQHPGKRFLEIGPDVAEIIGAIRKESPQFWALFHGAASAGSVRRRLHMHVLTHLASESREGLDYYLGDVVGREALGRLAPRQVAAIRLLDYVDHSGKRFADSNVPEGEVESDPVGLLWQVIAKGKRDVATAFLMDWYHLLRQYRGDVSGPKPSRQTVQGWMEQHPSGTAPDVCAEHALNRLRILRVYLKHMALGRFRRKRFRFPEGLGDHEKLALMEEWWQDYRFHLSFAIRTPALLNEMLDYSLSPELMATLEQAEEKGIPFFINPYYLSLILVRGRGRLAWADEAIRQYLFYSRELVEEYGQVLAWEKEDEVEVGQANAAGWLLPSPDAVHRRYPEVAILIPETLGRACAGLCASCQRMYDFQSGHLNFDLERLSPSESWTDRLARYLAYFEHDSQLRDILITGGDALMSRDESLRTILGAVLEMARRKREANQGRKDGEKFAEMQRIRLGTRLPAYLPQRVTDGLVELLSDFRRNAAAVGFEQFIIQTHFESPLEVTPEAVSALGRLLASGWVVTNQLVFTAAASRRGHTAQLRKVLNDAGVLTYYTFTVKGFRENRRNFAPNARALQEQMEEKRIGQIPVASGRALQRLSAKGGGTRERVAALRRELDVPFLATDRNVTNLPGVGKSLTFRTVGLTDDGRRILLFDHDHTRSHSPIVHRMGLMPIVESKSLLDYLTQLSQMGEDPAHYQTLWNYSIGETERRPSLYEYHPYPFRVTETLSNLDVESAMANYEEET